MEQTNQNKIRSKEEYKHILYSVANKVGMRDSDLYVKFMVERFPKETHIDYMRGHILYSVANKFGMRNSDLYVKFMVERFPKETHIDYMREWAFRFMSGNPIAYMDSVSTEIYNKIINLSFFKE